MEEIVHENTGDSRQMTDDLHEAKPKQTSQGTKGKGSGRVQNPIRKGQGHGKSRSPTSHGGQTRQQSGENDVIGWLNKRFTDSGAMADAKSEMTAEDVNRNKQQQGGARGRKEHTKQRGKSQAYKQGASRGHTQLDKKSTELHSPAHYSRTGRGRGRDDGKELVHDTQNGTHDNSNRIQNRDSESIQYNGRGKRKGRQSDPRRFTGQSDSRRFSDQSDPRRSTDQSDSRRFADQSDSRMFSNQSDSRRFADKSDSTRFTDQSDSRRFANKSDSTKFTEQSDSRRFANKSDSRGFANQSDSRRFAVQSDSTRFTDQSDSRRFANHSDFRGFANQSDPRRFSDQSDPRRLTDQWMVGGGYMDGNYDYMMQYPPTRFYGAAAEPMYMPYPDDYYQAQRQYYNHSRESRTKYGNKKEFSTSKSENASHSAQGGALTEQLLNESYECMVCCESLHCSAAVWSCQNCYHVYHLKCARKWATSATAIIQGEDGGWRCPACQNICKSVPNAYLCFCGKQRDPRWNPREGITPHSCGELCQKQRETTNCPHKCNQLCHPGPCPSCPVTVSKSCECGKKLQQVRCGQSLIAILCSDVCYKLLNCGIHTCQQICHTGPCGECEIQEQQRCYCGKVSRQSKCGIGDYNIVDDKAGYFSCEQICERLLDCDNHQCRAVCHKGPCELCALKPSNIKHCPCGQTQLIDILGEDNPRSSCLDPIPICDNICGKILSCSPKQGDGSKSPPHTCKLTCHHGPCGPCEGRTSVTCRCGVATKEIKCSEITSEDYLCDQRCNKKRLCGRHRCNLKCCTDLEHKCELICGKKLRCGTHTCEELCHRGYCPSCYMTGFDELTCYCGTTVLYPPIPCGTPPPSCPLPCSRLHPCSHPVTHTCHNETECPPCTQLTKKMCAGDHELRHNIPCHVAEVSCGKRCDRALPCGHNCSKLCHKPPWLADQERCTQPCSQPRFECDHPCGSPCHPGLPCPSSPCKVKITVTCKCGRRSEDVQCLKGGDKTSQAYQRFTTEALASKMKSVQLGQTVDLSGILMDDQSCRQIECNEDCALYERNRRLAVALSIDPEASPFKNYVPYSPSLLSDARCNIEFIKSVEESFEELIKTAAKTQSGQCTHSFNPMNSNQRRIIHEMAVHYNCSSRSYDLEPKRNTVITATKESRIPPVMLSTQITRQFNPPPPKPVPYLPTSPNDKARMKEAKPQAKSKTWAQVPDYFADDFND